jgi:hypothetical protein
MIIGFELIRSSIRRWQRRELTHIKHVNIINLEGLVKSKLGVGLLVLGVGVIRPETGYRRPATGIGDLFWILFIKTWSLFPSWYVIRNTWYQR